MLPAIFSGRKFFTTAALLALTGNLTRAADWKTIVWKLDDPKKAGGLTTEVIGAPRIADGATVFDGAHDGVFVPANPLDGAMKFTIEILFSPAGDGPKEQRFFHLQDTTAAEWRVMIETRVDGTGWWLDTYLGSPKGGQALIDPMRVHPTDQWYWAAVRFDGNTMTSFVNGEKELEATGVTFGPLGPGKLSLGVRQNKVYWFKGAIREVRFTSAVLPSEELQRVK